MRFANKHQLFKLFFWFTFSCYFIVIVFQGAVALANIFAGRQPLFMPKWHRNWLPFWCHSLQAQFVPKHPFQHALFQTVLFSIIKIYAFFNAKRWLPVLPVWILQWSLLIFRPIAKRILSAKAFTFPRYRYLRKFMSSFTSAKEPSAWILRFIRSIVPYSLVIRSRSSARFWLIVFETINTLLRFSIGVLQLFPLIHSVL